MLRLLFLLLCFIKGIGCIGQTGGYTLFKTFTTKDGLPSNHIYSTVQDKKGFLWVATENGICRFDGRYFQTFTTEDGLPDNEVLHVVMENDGTIWVNTFKKIPAYFDEVKNRFVVPSMPLERFKSLATSSVMYLYVINEGGVLYISGAGNYVFKSRELRFSSIIDGKAGTLIQQNKEEEIRASTFLNNSLRFYYKIKGGVIVDSSQYRLAVSKNYRDLVDDGKSIVSNNDNGNIYIFSDFQSQPFRFKLDSIVTGEPLFYIGNTPDYHTAFTRQGRILVYDKKTLQPVYTFSGAWSPNWFLNDKAGNIWISTVDKGLMLYKKSALTSFQFPATFLNTNFLSIANDDNGNILAGNQYGQVASISRYNFALHAIQNAVGNTHWIRKIIATKNKIITFSEGGTFINYSKQIKQQNGSFILGVKTAILISDSIIVYGNLKGLNKLNIQTGHTTPLKTSPVRITCIHPFASRYIYFGSTDGLYRYDQATDTTIELKNGHKLFSERIVAITSASNQLLFVATADKGILVIKDDKLIYRLSATDGIISNQLKTLYAKNNTLYAGTAAGLSIIHINVANGKIDAIQNVTINDGLCDNAINEITSYQDSIYMATGNGVAIIPENFSVSAFEIPVYITRVAVNSIDTVVTNHYKLKYYQNSISIQLAAIETSGHFGFFEYQIDNSGWQRLNATLLNLQLNGGRHTIKVRAVDVNNHRSQQTLAVEIIIGIPFWKSFWFWLGIAVLATAVLFSLANRQRLRKQQLQFHQHQQLVQQRQKITADLHDDIGATLSSLQLNSAVANALIGKDAGRAKTVMEKIENQSKELSEKISDIIWSMKPGKDEFMGLSSRIKNFANNILGSTTIAYTVEADKELDEIIQDISARKNIILIAKESINNAVKHSNASQISISLKRKNSAAVLVIQDNGKGIHAVKQDGNGLGNMQKRALEINGRLEISTSPENGTSIQLIVPLVP